jgi:hypothetical protein
MTGSSSVALRDTDGFLGEFEDRSPFYRWPMPNRPRARPSARRSLIFVLAAGLAGSGTVAGCGTVTPTRPGATIGPTQSEAPSNSHAGEPSVPAMSPTSTMPSGPGIAWRPVAVPGVPATMERIAIGLDRVVVAVDSGTTDGGPTGQIAFWSSADTVTWVAATNVPAADDGIVTAIAAVGNGFVAVGTDGTAAEPRAWVSADGRRWSVSPTIGRGAVGATTAAMTSVAVGPDGTIVAGGFADIPAQRLAIAWTSRDGGSTWRSSVVDGSGSRAQVQSVARGDPGWVATGIRDAGASFWLSRDGRVWVHIVPQPPAGSALGAESSADGVACMTDRCVAVGQGPSAGDGWAWWSHVPEVWNTVPSAAALPGGASRTVVASGNVFVAGGAGSDGRFGIWTSTDGHRWTASPQVAGPAGVVVDLAADGSRIVAVGPAADADNGFMVWIGAATP